jgi:hypothetical protein
MWCLRSFCRWTGAAREKQVSPCATVVTCGLDLESPLRPVEELAVGGRISRALSAILHVHHHACTPVVDVRSWLTTGVWS